MFSLMDWPRGIRDEDASSAVRQAAVVPHAEGPRYRTAARYLPDLGPGRLKLLAKHGRAFALTLYAQLHQCSKNLFFSPFSLAVALRLVLAGGRRQTAEEVRSGLQLISCPDPPRTALGKTARRLTAPGGQHELRIANSLWVQDGALLQQEFVDIIDGPYRRTVNLVEFPSNAAAVAGAIHDWVEEITE